MCACARGSSLSVISPHHILKFPSSSLTPSPHSTQMANGKWCRTATTKCGHVLPISKDQDPWVLHRHSEPACWHSFSWSQAIGTHRNIDSASGVVLAPKVQSVVTALFLPPHPTLSPYCLQIDALKQWE